MHDLYKLYVLLNSAGYEVKITRWEYIPPVLNAGEMIHLSLIL